MIEVRYERGVYLPHQDLWLDPWDAKRFAFVSHAHGDHIAPHQEIIVSQRTARLMQSRLPGNRTEHILPFGERRTVHGVDLMLLPAGPYFWIGTMFPFCRQRDIALHRRFQAASREIRGKPSGATRIHS